MDTRPSVGSATKRLVLGVILDSDTHALIDLFEHIPEKAHNEAAQAQAARDAVSSVLSAHSVAAAVLLEADYHKKSRVQAGTKQRLRLEGAVLSACLDKIPTVEVMNGPALGRACGTKKEDAVATAAGLVTDARFSEAAAAAMAACSLV